MNYCSDLKSVFSKQLHVKLKANFRVLGENTVLTKKSQLSGISQTIISLGYPSFQKKKKKKKKKKKMRFCNALILKTMVKVNVHPLSQPIWFPVTINLRGNRVLMHVLER